MSQFNEPFTDPMDDLTLALVLIRPWGNSCYRQRLKEVSLFVPENVNSPNVAVFSQDTQSCSDPLTLSNTKHICPTIFTATYEICPRPQSNILFIQRQEKAILVSPI